MTLPGLPTTVQIRSAKTGTGSIPLYLDAAYIVKVYLSEPGSDAVRALVKRADSLTSSALSIAEVNCVFHRRLRDGRITRDHCLELTSTFARHVTEGLWDLAPVSQSLLKRTSALVISAPPGMFIRAGDSIQMLTAQELGEPEIWTSDKHVLAAAPWFGLVGRSVGGTGFSL